MLGIAVLEVDVVLTGAVPKVKPQAGVETEAVVEPETGVEPKAGAGFEPKAGAGADAEPTAGGVPKPPPPADVDENALADLAPNNPVELLWVATLATNDCPDEVVFADVPWAAGSKCERLGLLPIPAAAG